MNKVTKMGERGRKRFLPDDRLKEIPESADEGFHQGLALGGNDGGFANHADNQHHDDSGKDPAGQNRVRDEITEE